MGHFCLIMSHTPIWFGCHTTRVAQMAKNASKKLSVVKLLAVCQLYQRNPSNGARHYFAYFRQIYGKM